MSDIKVKAKVGDKVKIVKADNSYRSYYGNGAEGVVIAAEEGWPGVDVNFTSGFKLSTDDSDQKFHVYHQEYEIIGSEAEKEKEVNQIKLKSNVYAVIVGSEILELASTRELARIVRKGYKLHNPTEKFHIMKLSPEKFVR